MRLAAVGALLAAVGVLAAGAGATSRAVGVYGGCPRDVRQLGYLSPAQFIAAAKAAKAQLPRVFKSLGSMGEPAWPGFEIQGIVTLQPVIGFLPKLSGFRAYFARAQRACGTAAARSSLLVLLYFPGCQIPCSEAWAYVTATRHGWHLWATTL